MQVHLVRAYEVSKGRKARPGVRVVLVDRMWPRGIKKDSLKVDEWCKEVAPSTDLRRWFSHQPDKCPEFERRYAAELDDCEAAWRPLLEAAQGGGGGLTLVYAAKDKQHNNAVALRAYLQRKAAEGGAGAASQGGSGRAAAGKKAGKHAAAGEAEAEDERRAKRPRRAEE